MILIVLCGGWAVLSQYLQQTKRLLQNPPAPVSLYSDSDLSAWINTARGQLAGKSQSIRVQGTLTTVINNRISNFSAISVTGTSGVAGVIHVRQIMLVSGTGFKTIRTRNWEWFEQYLLNNVAPVPGAPVVWSQYGQGVSGSLYLDPIPNNIYSLQCDCVCYPIPLVDDTTPEAIPYLWTDAVPYFAAYQALLAAQTPARQADAERMYNHYETFVELARTASTPDVLSYLYPQSQDPTLINKLGLSPKAGAQ